MNEFSSQEELRCLVLAHSDARYVRLVRLHFQNLGWKVCTTSSGCEARNLARAFSPAVIALDTNLADQSGWLTCDKLTGEFPDSRIVLVGKRWNNELRRFGEFVGAVGIVYAQDGATALLREIETPVVPVTG